MDINIDYDPPKKFFCPLSSLRPLFAQCRSTSNITFILYLFLVYIVQKKLLTAGVELCSENIKHHTAGKHLRLTQQRKCLKVRSLVFAYRFS